MSAEEHSRQPNQVKNGRPKWLSIFLSISLLALALVPAARSVLFDIDHQFANLAGGGLLLIAVLFGFAGLWVLFARTRLQHLAFAIMPFVLAGGAWAVLGPEGLHPALAILDDPEAIRSGMTPAEALARRSGAAT